MSQYDNKDRSRSGFTHQPYHGLINQGSTCYLNSVLQVLFMTKDFRDAVERYDCDGKCLDFHLKQLFYALKVSTGSTCTLTDGLGISGDLAQSDAAACFENILSRVTNPAASQLFQGMLTTKNRCSTCNKETSAENPFWSLHLEMEDCDGGYCVTDGIENYFKESHLNELNQLYCEHCSNKSDTTITVEIKHHPEVLTLLLKRFKFDYLTMKHVKVRHNVRIPEYLLMPPNGDTSPIYQLYAYVEHSGKLRSGHYVVTIRAQDHDGWYLFNDDRVSLRYPHPFIDNKHEINSRAYLLFYKKVSTTTPCNADDAGPSTPECNKSDQCSRNGEEPREGEESKEDKASPECSGAREKTHQNEGEMDHNATAGTGDNFLSPTYKPSELRKQSEINNDDNSRGQGNKQKVLYSRENTPCSENLHNKQHQDIGRKQDVSDKLSENHATHLSDEDVGVSKPETREQHKHSKTKEHEDDATRTEGKDKELFDFRENQKGISKVNKQEANQEKIKPDIRDTTTLLTIEDLVKNPIVFQSSTSEIRPESKILKMTDKNSTGISRVTRRNRNDDPTETNRKENEGEHPTCHTAKAERCGQVTEGGQETRPLSQPEQGIIAPLCAANQNPVTSSTTNTALEKGEIDAKSSHTSGGSGAVLQQSLGPEDHGLDTVTSGLQGLKLSDS